MIFEIFLLTFRRTYGRIISEEHYQTEGDVLWLTKTPKSQRKSKAAK
jgi:hypothetical protein